MRPLFDSPECSKCFASVSVEPDAEWNKGDMCNICTREVYKKLKVSIKYYEALLDIQAKTIERFTDQFEIVGKILIKIMKESIKLFPSKKKIFNLIKEAHEELVK